MRDDTNLRTLDPIERETLRRATAVLGWKGREAARRSGIARERYYQLMRGDRKARPEERAAMFAAVGLDGDGPAAA